MNPRVLLAACTLLLALPCAGARAEPVEFHVQTGHVGQVVCVALSEDERLALSGGFDRAVRLWKVDTGEELRSFEGHGAHGVFAVAFAPEARRGASAGDDGTVRLWNLETGREEARWEAPPGIPRALAFSRDGSRLAAGGDGGLVRLWRIEAMAPQADLRAPGPVQSLAFSPDGTVLAAGGSGFPIQVYQGPGFEPGALLRLPGSGVFDLRFVGDDALSVLSFRSPAIPGARGQGEVERLDLRMEGGTVRVAGRTAMGWGRAGALGAAGEAVVLRPQGGGALFLPGQREVGLALSESAHCAAVGRHQVLVGYIMGWLERFSTSTGKPVGALRAWGEPVTALAFLDGGRTLAVGDWAGRVRVWGLDAAGWVASLATVDGPVQSLAPDPEMGWLAGACSGAAAGQVRVWRSAPAGLVEVRSASVAEPTAVAFLGADLLCGGVDPPLLLWKPGAAPTALKVSGSTTRSLAVHGARVARAAEDGTVTLWPRGLSGAAMVQARHGKEMATGATFSPDGSLLASSGLDGRVVLGAADGQGKLAALRGDGQGFHCLGFSRDGRRMAAGSETGEVWVWSRTGSKPGDWSPQRRLQGHTRGVEALQFHPGGRWLATGSGDGTVRLWDLASGQEAARLFGLGEADWVVMDSLGRFDGSQAGLQRVHVVAGLEPVDLDQIKPLYFEPGLLPKLLGYAPEALREVPPLKELDLYPEVEVVQATGSAVDLRLKPRGAGGVGRVEVRVNGVETAVVQPPPGATELHVDLPGARLVPGRDNPIDVVASNREGTAASRAYRLSGPRAPGSEPPASLFLVVAGVSRYDHPDLQLQYPARDALDLARVLLRGGRRRFGQERVHAVALAEGPAEPGIEVREPTREGLEEALAEVARQAKPEDVLVLFLAGHGMSDGQRYAFLTREASLPEGPGTAASAGGPRAAGPAAGIPAAGAVTSDDLRRWLLDIDAVNRVVILDTCAAAAAASGLSSSDEIRALDALAGPQNLHLLMGCARDAESFEAAEYEHGFLTYSLLLGLQGPALRDGEYANVLGLFDFASNEVPRMASRAGRSQKPRVSTPGAAEDFVVARLGEEEKRSIVLASPRAQVLRPRVDDGAEDPLDLEGLLTEALLASAREGFLDFRDEARLPGAFGVRGQYAVEGAGVQLKLSLVRDGKKVATRDVLGSTADLPALVRAIRDAVVEEIRASRVER